MSSRLPRGIRSRVRGARAREHVRDEQGLTLVELMIALTTLLILFVMTIPIVDTLFSTIPRVNNTYINVNQLLPVSTNLQRFIRSAVEPGPTSGGVPVPPFVTGSVTPTSVTFYTNIGDTNGPAKIVASCRVDHPVVRAMRLRWCLHRDGSQGQRRDLSIHRVGLHLGDREDPDHRRRRVQCQ